MPNYNKIIMIGHITRDPQLSYLPSQTAVVEFGIANNHRYTSNGSQKEEVCFIDCRCYGKQAENINKFFSKGKPILIEGRLQFDQWEAQDGSKRSKHRIFVERFTFVESNNSGSAPAEPSNQVPDTQTSVPVDDVPF